MALLVSGSSSLSSRLLCFPCSWTPVSKASCGRIAYTAACCVNLDGEESIRELVPRRAALVRAGYGVGLWATSLALGGGVGECGVEEKGRAKFYELEGSGGVKALDVRQGAGVAPVDGDRVEIHYYGRLAAKQGWRFDSTYDHKDFFGNPEPYVFTVGDEGVIGGMSSAVRTMKEGGVRRVVIPPSQGYQNTSQAPIPPDYFDRQRLYTTIFNQTRLANGEGDTLGTLIFDIELLKVRKPQ